MMRTQTIGVWAAGCVVAGLACGAVLAAEGARSAAVDIKGRVVFQGTAEPPVDFRRLDVYVFDATNPGLRAKIEVGLARNPLPTATVKPDGTFQLIGVPPGKYSFDVAGPIPQSWRPLQSAISGTRNVLDAPLEITPDATSVPDLVLTFSIRHAASE